MSNPEIFSGNVCSDIYWPEEVIMEVTSGPIAPLAYGRIKEPERYTLNRKNGKIEFRRGSNSPVLGKFVKKGLDMNQIKELMELAGKMPCTLEFIYGPIKKIERIAPLIFDVRVLENVKWEFYNTNAIWKVLDGNDFLYKFILIASIAANEGISKKKSTLTIGPTGSAIFSNERKIDPRLLFEIDIFSPKKKILTIKKDIPKERHYLDDFIVEK